MTNYAYPTNSKSNNPKKKKKKREAALGRKLHQPVPNLGGSTNLPPPTQPAFSEAPDSIFSAPSPMFAQPTIDSSGNPTSTSQEDSSFKYDKVTTKWTHSAGLVATGIVLIFIAWLIAIVWVGFPILDRSWSISLIVPLIGALFTAWGFYEFVSRRNSIRIFYIVLWVLLPTIIIGAFAWGITHSVVIKGKIYLESSEPAQAYRLASKLQSNLAYFIKVEDLLALDAQASRTRFKELSPAQRELEYISQDWDLVSIESLPNGIFAPVVAQARSAAYFGAQALDRKILLLGNSNERLVSELASFRETFTRNILQMRPDLIAISDKYGFTLPPLDSNESSND
jgi:hypothetical protein